MMVSVSKHENITPTIVLETLQGLLDKSYRTKTGISVDTLVLHLSLNVQQLIPLLDELEFAGKIRRAMPTAPSNRASGMGTVITL